LAKLQGGNSYRSLFAFSQRLDNDLDFSMETSQQRQKQVNGKVLEHTIHEVGHVRLFENQDFGRLMLAESALLKDFVNLMRQLRLEQYLIGVLQADVSKYIPRTFDDPFRHFMYKTMPSPSIKSRPLENYILVPVVTLL